MIREEADIAAKKAKAEAEYSRKKRYVERDDLSPLLWLYVKAVRVASYDYEAITSYLVLLVVAYRMEVVKQMTGETHEQGSNSMLRGV